MTGAAASTGPGGRVTGAAASTGPAVVVDRIRCDGRGLCAELLPERVHLDEWGYPIVEREPVGPELEAAARAAVAQCPRLALSLRA